MELNVRQKKVVNAEEPNILCLATAACGKALPNSTEVATPDGFKNVGEIKVGNYLFDRNGNPTKVLGVYPQGKSDVYEITFGDGRKAKCNLEHIWRVHKEAWEDDEWKDLTLKEILECGFDDKKNTFYIPNCEAVRYSEKSYKVPPYVIGAFLGRGHCGSSYLTLLSENSDIPTHIGELLGCNEIYKNSNNYNWIFKKGEQILMTSALGGACQSSFYKRIPEMYKYGSVEQRLELVRGLMDTAGSIIVNKSKKRAPRAIVTFTSSSYELVMDFKEVLGSLGYTSIVKVCSNKTTYRLLINVPNREKHKLFWSPRKKEIALSVKNVPQKKKYDRVSIKKIEKLNYQEDMTCFYVDNEEHLFLMNDFIVTHNTRIVIERIKRLLGEGVSPKDIVAITFTNMAAEEMRRRIGDAGKDMFIGTIHAYANSICRLNNIDLSQEIAREQFDKILTKAMIIPDKKYPKIKHLFVDEFQDTTQLEYNFLEKVQTENRFYVGDNRQLNLWF